MPCSAHGTAGTPQATKKVAVVTETDPSGENPQTLTGLLSRAHGSAGNSCVSISGASGNNPDPSSVPAKPGNSWKEGINPRTDPVLAVVFGAVGPGS